MPTVGGLTVDMIIVLALLAFTILLSISNFIRVDVVAVVVLAILGMTRLLPPGQLFSGFGSEAAISLIAVMIIGAGLEKSGIALKASRWILKLGRERPKKISMVLMILSGILSGIMRSLGTIALMLPVVTRITARTGIPKSRLLMPMTICSILGGTLTMVGSSPLILLNGLLLNNNAFLPAKKAVEPFHFFSVFPLGILLLSTGIIYLMVIGRKLLPKEPIETVTSGTTKSQFMKTYGKGTDIFEIRVPQSSSLINKNLREFETLLDPSCSVLAIMQGKDLHFPPLRKIIIVPNSMMAIMGTKENVIEFTKKYGLRLFPRLNVFAELLHPVRAGLCEAVIPPSSSLIGHELRELHMRRNYELHVLALYRDQKVYRGNELNDLVLRSGDTLGIFCEWEALSDFHKNPDFVVLTTSYPREEIRPKKIGYALFFFILAVFLIVGGGYSVSVGLFLGAVGMIGTGVLTIDEAYEAVSWKTVFLLAGLIPLGLVMQTTQTADWLIQHSLHLWGNLSVVGIEVCLAILTTLLTFVLSGVGATIVLVPVAMELAVRIGGDPRLFALIVAVSCSNTFLMPMQQANALIIGPGNYQFKDFVRLGSPMTILYWIVMLVGINLLF